MEKGDCQDAGQLHGPPDDSLHGQHRVADPRTHKREDEHQQREVGQTEVVTRHQTMVFVDHPCLPQSVDEQEGRENQGHNGARQHDDTEGDDRKGNEDQRIVDAVGVVGLRAVHAQEQGGEDDRQHPRIFQKQAAGHVYEVGR